MIQPQEKVKFRKGFKTWADNITVDLRKQLGLYDTSPLSAFDLCKHLSIPIWQPSDVVGLPNEKLDELLNSGSEFWSAATIPLDNGGHIIIHNPKHSPARQQSNLMHELAHILCEHKISEDIQKSGLASFLRCHNDNQEHEAEWLGACLQLPRPALIWALKRNMTIEQISESYYSSIEMTKFRVNITGAKKQISYSNRPN